MARGYSYLKKGKSGSCPPDELTVRCSSRDEVCFVESYSTFSSLVKLDYINTIAMDVQYEWLRGNILKVIGEQQSVGHGRKGDRN